jgi:hypothetical protein
VDTFVIRLWRPADPAATAAGQPRGVARHVATGRAGAFRDGTELLALLEALPSPEDDRATTPNEPDREPA